MTHSQIQAELAPFRYGAFVSVEGGDGAGATGRFMQVPVTILDAKSAWGETSVLIEVVGGTGDRVWKKLSSLDPRPEPAPARISNDIRTFSDLIAARPEVA